MGKSTGFESMRSRVQIPRTQIKSQARSNITGTPSTPELWEGITGEARLAHFSGRLCLKGTRCRAIEQTPEVILWILNVPKHTHAHTPHTYIAWALYTYNKHIK